MSNIVIGIEGYVGAGKTSICRELLKHIPNSIILHGGNLYRGIIYAFMHSAKNIDLKNLKDSIHEVDAKKLMEDLKVEFKIENRESVVYIAGKKIEEEKLQSEDSSLAVSIAGANANSEQFYLFARHLIDQYKKVFNVIVSGRDLMKIYPNLDYHFLITASLEERVRRKMKQYGEKADYCEVKENIEKRDALQEKSGYYKTYDNTIVVDVTECKTVQESTLKVMEYIKEKDK